MARQRGYWLMPSRMKLRAVQPVNKTHFKRVLTIAKATTKVR